jgi:glycosyltransferase involved in cell wall biosynthesis
MQKKLRVLWFSNRVFDITTDNRSGTWLLSLGPELVKTGQVELANISIGGCKNKNIYRSDYGEIKQWLVPECKVNSNGLPNKTIISQIVLAVKEFEPDIIQIWGVENYWGLLTARKIIKGNVLLNIQGILASITPVFYGGLTNLDLLNCIGIREIIKPNTSLFAAKKEFTKKLDFENEIIKGHKYIVTQSDWTNGQISAINSNFLRFETQRTLRKEFTETNSWLENNNTKLNEPVLFTTSMGNPYKGIHILIKALEKVKVFYPNIKLRIAGNFSNSWKSSGYEKYLVKLIEKLKLYNNIEWLGPLSAEKIIENMKAANIFVQPSFIESYSLALSEALYLGIPSVVSYAGAMPELAINNKSALFFTPGDYVGCAYKIRQILLNKILAKQLSINARNEAMIRNSVNMIVENQIDIYRKVIIENNNYPIS